MNLEELEEIVDSAIARWEDPNLPKLPDSPKFTIGHPDKDIEILPNIFPHVLGFNSRKRLYILQFDAKEVKRAIAYYKAEF